MKTFSVDLITIHFLDFDAPGKKLLLKKAGHHNFDLLR